MVKEVVRIISLIIIIMIFFTIFGFSNQDSNQSGSTSAKVAKILIELQPKYKNITDEEKENLIEHYQPFVRKSAHFSIYTVLGISLTTFFCTYNLSNKKRIIFAILIGFLYAASDEIHQTFIPGRSGQISDVLLDTFGVTVGMLITISMYINILKRKKTT